MSESRGGGGKKPEVPGLYTVVLLLLSSRGPAIHERVFIVIPQASGI